MHKGKTLFLSSSGRDTLKELGIEDGDEITVGGVHLEYKDDKKASSTTKKSSKRNNPKKSRKKRSRVHSTPVLSQEQIMEKYREEHSKAMTPVFEELGPLLENIRHHLNDLTIQKTAPKTRSHESRKKSNISEELSPSALVQGSFGGKAGKVDYPILVGEVSNLYKTSKSPPHCHPIVFDLHGCTKDQALDKLNGNLPVWIDTAMGGENTCFSDVVKDWIHSTHQVANMPKGYFG